MSPKRLKAVRPDTKGRITLGRLTMVELANEKWLFNNKSALAEVKQGLKDAALGRVKSRGSFVKYLEDDTEE